MYKENGDLKKLAANKAQIKLAVQATKENYHVIQALGYPLDSTHKIPNFILEFLYSKLCNTYLYEIGMKGHAMSASGREEMKNLEKDLQINHSKSSTNPGL